MSILDRVNFDLLETDCQIIREFEWVADDTPLPVDPTDYAQLRAALYWSDEVKRYPEYSYDDDEEDEGDNSFFENDMLALAEFQGALRRRMRAIENYERAKLAAWNAGKPIPTSGVIV